MLVKFFLHLLFVHFFCYVVQCHTEILLRIDVRKLPYQIFRYVTTATFDNLGFLSRKILHMLFEKCFFVVFPVTQEQNSLNSIADIEFFRGITVPAVSGSSEILLCFECVRPTCLV